MSAQNMMHVESAVSAFTGDPFVLLTWDVQAAQMDPDAARAFALHIIAAADAAETDAILHAELKGLGLDADTATRFLLAIREKRGA